MGRVAGVALAFSLSVYGTVQYSTFFTIDASFYLISSADSVLSDFASYIGLKYLLPGVQ